MIFLFRDLMFFSKKTRNFARISQRKACQSLTWLYQRRSSKKVSSSRTKTDSGIWLLFRNKRNTFRNGWMEKVTGLPSLSPRFWIHKFYFFRILKNSDFILQTSNKRVQLFCNFKKNVHLHFFGRESKSEEFLFSIHC